MSTWFHPSSWFSLYGIERLLTYIRRAPLSFGMVGNRLKRLIFLNIGVKSSLFLEYFVMG
jgi:hypothetical protein